MINNKWFFIVYFARNLLGQGPTYRVLSIK